MDRFRNDNLRTRSTTLKTRRPGEGEGLPWFYTVHRQNALAFTREKKKRKKIPRRRQSRRNIFAAKEIILPPIKSDLIVHLFSLVGLRIENREHRWFSQFYRCFVVDVTNISSIDNIFHVSCKYVAIKSSILELLMQDSWESWGYFFFSNYLSFLKKGRKKKRIILNFHASLFYEHNRYAMRDRQLLWQVIATI